MPSVESGWFLQSLFHVIVGNPAPLRSPALLISLDKHHCRSFLLPLTALYLCAYLFPRYGLKALSATRIWAGWEPNWNEEPVNWHWGSWQLLPAQSRALLCPFPPCAVPVAGKSLDGKGKVLQAGLWFLVCHLGSCGREVLVTRKQKK